MNVAFTICSNNYLAKAKVVADTFVAYHNEYEFYIFLVDKINSKVDYQEFARFHIIEAADIIANIDELAIKYNIVELNTAIKPAAFLHLFQNNNVANVIYLDPDTMIFNRFIEVEEILEDEEANMVVTPHFCSPIDDGKYPSEIDLTVYGLYNLGFIAIKNTQVSKEMLLWWHDRLMKYCFNKPSRGMFTDQLWINYAPIFYDGVYILKHLGYNVANWNLFERVISKSKESFLVNEKYILRFFHFSHYKYDDPYLISTTQNRFTISERSDVKVLIDAYQNELIKNKHSSFANLTCYYFDLYKDNKRQLDLEYYTFKRKVKNKLVEFLNQIVPD